MLATMATDPKNVEARKAAQRDLHTLGRSDSVFTGSVGSTITNIKTHFAGADDPADDAVVIWGKRIGRALGLLGVIGLSIYLYLTYIR